MADVMSCLSAVPVVIVCGLLLDHRLPLQARTQNVIAWLLLVMAALGGWYVGKRLPERFYCVREEFPYNPKLTLRQGIVLVLVLLLVLIATPLLVGYLAHFMPIHSENFVNLCFILLLQVAMRVALRTRFFAWVLDYKFLGGAI